MCDTELRPLHPSLPTFVHCLTNKIGLRGKVESKFGGREFFIMLVFISPSALQNRRTRATLVGVGIWCGREVPCSLFWTVFAASVWEARGLVMCITDSLITQNLPSVSSLCLPVWLWTSIFRAGWEQDR